MLAVIDYGAGNLKSVANALDAIEADFRVTSDPKELENARGIILPGVGAFGEGMGELRRLGMDEALNRRVIEAGVPYLGICLGMQFLAEIGREHGDHRGLGWVDAEVVKLAPDSREYRVPHMGWNDLEITRDSILFEGLGEAPVFYFVHSYHLQPREGGENVITSVAWHGQRVAASAERDNIYGVQFHPEKSQANGLTVLKNFIKRT